MIINHNCCIKLVPLVIHTENDERYQLDARSHIHQDYCNFKVHLSTKLYNLMALTKNKTNSTTHQYICTDWLSLSALLPVTISSNEARR